MIQKVLIYSTKEFEKPFLEQSNNGVYLVSYTSERLTSKTAMLAVGFTVISIFSADDASSIVLEKLKDFGVKYISLRSAGHDNINIKSAAKFKLNVANAPGYSPQSIAEHAITLLFGLNRNLVLSQKQIKVNNFSLNNLVGFDLYQKTVGIIGTGRIGGVLTKILHGFGCAILGNDIREDHILTRTYALRYMSFKEVCKKADVIFIATPLTPDTHYMFDTSVFQLMKKDAVLINIARGGIVNTKSLLKALDEHKLGGYGADVYEKENGLFFYDFSKVKGVVNDDLLSRLVNNPKVLLTPHQAFATKKALAKIAETTFYNINCWKENLKSTNELTP
jgi:D-lactate dehydrogenase